MAPSSTYRVQLHHGFTFDDAVGILDQLRDLGVTHLYASPLLGAQSGSLHGYDVVDPEVVDADRGGEEGFARLSAAIADRDMGLVVDIVPNHVAVLTDENRWWWQLLRDGPGSEHDATFDVRWEQRPDAPPCVVLPVLGAPLDEVGDQLRLALDDDGAPVVTYHEHRMPVRVGSLAEAGLPAEPARAVAAAAHDPGAVPRLARRQFWRLAHWRRGADEVNYRRFFDVTTLGGVRMEDPVVADRVLGRTLRMVDEGQVDGIRVDHPDGLRDPAGTLERLRRGAPTSWLVVEKIVEGDERLRDDWPVDGDVGYPFLNEVLRLVVEPTSRPRLEELAERWTGTATDVDAIVLDAKREVVDVVLVAEREMLTELFLQAAEELDVPATRTDARDVVRALLVAFDRYRTYVVPERDKVVDADRATVARARDRACELVDTRQEDLLGVLCDVLVLDRRSPTADELVARFQQVTGPVMAKGFEDTVCYRDVRFVALNEVGGDVTRVAVSPAEFHAANEDRVARRPTAMLTTSTHDTKRSEDVRARLAGLSHAPDAWQAALDAWRDVLPRHRGEHGPDPALEYLALQCLVGAWPITPERLRDYLRKAAREAKTHTTHLDPDTAFESDVDDWVDGVLADDAFLAPLATLLDVLRPLGRRLSLVQSLLRCTSPGVPDTYQGNELWDLSLVDPDNRRPVDHGSVRRLLDELDDGVHDDRAVVASLDDPDDPGLAKLLVVSRALRTRRAHPAAFGPTGTYEPLELDGPAPGVAFARGDGSGPPAVVAVAATRPLDVRSTAATTCTLPDGRWRDQLRRDRVHEGTVALDTLVGGLGVALLVADW